MPRHGEGIAGVFGQSNPENRILEAMVCGALSGETGKFRVWNTKSKFFTIFSTVSQVPGEAHKILAIKNEVDNGKYNEFDKCKGKYELKPK